MLSARAEFGYNDIDLFRVEGSMMFTAHGIVSKDSSVHQYDGTGQVVPSTPSTENPFAGENGAWELSSGTVEYSFVFGGEGEMKVTSWFSFSASAYFCLVWNKDNVSKPCAFDTQLSLGAVFKY